MAVVDGRETEEERDGLTEDALLHDGYGCRNVALIWAPKDLSPDAYLESMAAFRAVFPPHRDTPGALKMQQALLAALHLPHAYGEGLEFLLSNGEADVQGPGHLRWVAYEDLGEVAAWLARHTETIQLVVARSEVAEGVVVEEGAVLSMGVYICASTKIVDRATGEVHFGRVPAYSVVVPGTLPGKPLAGGAPGPGLYCAVIVKRVDEGTRAKTSINELLRD